MNNRILTTLFALALCLFLFIGVVPAEADAATTCGHAVRSRSYVPEKPATCTEGGNDAYYYCTECGMRYADATTTVALVDQGSVEHGPLGHTADNELHTAEGQNKHWNECVRCSAKMNAVLHAFTTPKEVEGNDTAHAMYCECGARHADGVKHTFVKEVTAEGHTYTCKDCGKVHANTGAHVDNGTKDCKCDICGYEIPHDFSKCVLSDESYHKTLCAACGVEKENSRVTHNFTWGTTADKCVGTCSECNYKTTEKPHTFTFADNEDGTHTRTCSVCGYSDIEDHVDGDPVDCKCVGCAAQMEHTYEGWQKGDNTHWHQCTVCNNPVDQAEHEFEYTAAPYGTKKHKKICKVCGYEEAAEDCVDKDDDHYCDDCGGLRNHNGAESSMITHHKTMTCEEDGIWLHYECPTCHELFRNGKVVTGQDMTNPAKGHELVWAKAQPTGHYQYCTNTGCKYHTDEEEHTFTYKYNNNGTHEKVCSVCGYKDDDEPCSIKEKCTCACGHLFVHRASDAKMVYTSHKAPTCEEDGNTSYYTCKDCGNRFVKTVSDDSNVQYTTPGDPTLTKLGHDWKNEMTISGKHLQRCARCEISEYQEHTSSTGGCTCDIVLKNGKVCGQLVHSHEAVKVARKAPTCLEEGYEAYWQYKGCGRMFANDFARTEIEAPIAIPATGHPDTECKSKGDTHADFCTVCGEEITDSATDHVDDNEDNYCDDCGAAINLVETPAVAPTCDLPGKMAFYSNPLVTNGRKYYDAAGTKLVEDENDLLIPKLDHKGGLTATDNGNGYHTYSCSLCNKYSLTEKHTGGCFCTICGVNKEGHKLTEYERVEATCDKEGHKAYSKCSCGKFYDAGDNETTYNALVLRTSGHKWGTKLFNDDAAGEHYVVCTVCGGKSYREHKMTVKDPLSGNAHQFICECGKVTMEAHYDNNGDKVCDVKGCEHDMSGRDVVINNNPSTTVVTGDKNTVNTGWSWLRNWLNNAVGSNAGGSTTPTQTAQPGTATGSQGSTTGNNGTTTTPATGSNTGSTGAGSSNAGSSTQGGNQTAEATGVLQAIISFFNWILSGFGG